MMKQISPARRVAFEILEAVGQGAYASNALLEASAALESRDAHLAYQIVFGSLRYQAQLDHLIFHFSGRPAAELDPPVAIALRMAIFQIRYLDRVPAFSAVHEAVELVKRHKRAASGFVNAVLRKVDRSEVKWPNLAVELSCPPLLLERWSSQFGADAARRIARAALNEPAVYIRTPTGRTQDIGSQAIIPLLGLEAGHTYLDVCAAPGNKTLQALETPLKLAIACDISPARIAEIPPVCPRVVLDGTQPLPFSGVFDRILVDAPCSGTGTLARNPEIKWRVEPDDFIRFQKRQVDILTQALRHLASGGRLVYATCSLEPEENEEVVRAVLSASPDLRCEKEWRRVPGREEGDGFYAAVFVTLRP